MRLGKAIATGYAVEAAEQQDAVERVRPDEVPVSAEAEAEEPVPADAGVAG